LDKNYPKEKRIEIKKLDIKGGLYVPRVGGYNVTIFEKVSFESKKLQGPLDLRDFVNLEKLNCSVNKITDLNLSSCGKLKNVDCHDNQLINLKLPSNNQIVEFNCKNNYLTDASFIKCLNPTTLTELSIFNNNFSPLDLEILRPFINLEVL